jgi:tyrosyl-tRNA synthetase
MPQVRLKRRDFEEGYNVVDLFTDAALTPTKSEGRRLVLQGGAFVGAAGDSSAALTALTDVGARIGVESLNERGELLLRAGKKRYCRVVTVS